MSRPLGVVSLVVALAISGCTSLQTAVKQTPAGNVTPSPAPSPTPIEPLQITSVAFHNGELTLAYTPVTPAAKGGVKPYTWNVTAGSLPPGLVMDSTGKITGTPNALGTYLFTVEVADAMGTTQSISSSISVARRVAVTGNPCTMQSPCNVEAGCVTACGEFGFLSGGIGPYKYKVTKGSLPTGMGLSGFKLTKAFPAPPAGGTKDWVFTVRVTDSIGAWAETTAKFHVYPHIAWGPVTGQRKCLGSPTAGCTITLTYTLGTPNLPNPKVNVQVTVGPALPNGWTAVADTGTVTFTVPAGYSTANQVKLVLIDTSTCGNNIYCASLPATVVFQ